MITSKHWWLQTLLDRLWGCEPIVPELHWRGEAIRIHHTQELLVSITCARNKGLGDRMRVRQFDDDVNVMLYTYFVICAYVLSKRDCSSLAWKREHIALDVLEPRFSRAHQALQSHVAAECFRLGGGAWWGTERHRIWPPRMWVRNRPPARVHSLVAPWFVPGQEV